MTNHTFINAGVARLPKAFGLRASAATTVWAGGRARMEANPYSLAERWRG
jgi:hypothetical protein